MSSSSPFFEIVELPSGDVVLRRVDDERDELVKISFSKEAKGYLGEYIGEVGRAMIGTGVQMVGKLYDQNGYEEGDETHTLH